MQTFFWEPITFECSYFQSGYDPACITPTQRWLVSYFKILSGVRTEIITGWWITTKKEANVQFNLKSNLGFPIFRLFYYLLVYFIVLMTIILFQQGDNCMQSPAPFQNIFKFCKFLPRFSDTLPFFNIFLPFFLKIACMPLLSRIGHVQLLYSWYLDIIRWNIILVTSSVLFIVILPLLFVTKAWKRTEVLLVLKVYERYLMIICQLQETYTAKTDSTF